MHPTIFALSTGNGRAGIAVIRITGPAAGAVLDAMSPARPPPRYAALRAIRHPRTGELLDRGLVLWLPAPKSETGEDMAELHLHGSPVVVRAVLAALGDVPGCRPAEPGAFARRAFENGRMDLTEVEGLADLIDAETDAQRRQALAQASGALARLYDGWRERLIAARALVEAAIDFSDEGDVATDAAARGRAEAAHLAAAIAAHLAGANRGEIVRDGFRVVLAGAPNAGKSSLLNALARRDVAIVSPEAGTTRDVIEVHLDLGGYAVVVADTAGLRPAEGLVEAEGIRRTLTRAREADLVVWLVDATHPQWQPPADLAPLGRLLVVLNKIDAAPDPALPDDTDPSELIQLSVSTGAGLAALVDRLARVLGRQLGDTTATPPPTRERHRHSLDAALAATRRAAAEPAQPPEIVAEELRIAADALARIVGRIDAEDVLDRIFNRFCIGK